MGYNRARSRTTSQSPRVANVPTSSWTCARRLSAIALTTRGASIGSRTRRYFTCAGGSIATGMSGTGTPAALNASADEKMSGLRWAKCTASALVSTHVPSAAWNTAPSSVIARHPAVRSAAMGRSQSRNDVGFATIRR